MRNKLFLFTIVFISISFFGTAQSLSYDNSGVLYLYPNDTREAPYSKRGGYVGPHILGDTLTEKLNVFEKKYIYFKPGSGAYAVEEKVTVKPVIYKSVKKIDSYFTNQYKSKKLPKAECTARLSAIIDIAVKLTSYETTQVEKDLKNIKDPVLMERYLLSLGFRESKN